jgi:hypothetical protein
LPTKAPVRRNAPPGLTETGRAAAHAPAPAPAAQHPASVLRRLSEGGPPPGREEVLLLQRTLGNRATGLVLASRGGAPAVGRPGADVLQRVTFSRFSGLGWFSFYSSEEKVILATERRVRDLLNDMRPYAETKWRNPLTAIAQEFHGVEAASYRQPEYAGLSRRLNDIFGRLDTLSTRIAAEEFRFTERYGRDNEDLLEETRKPAMGRIGGALLQVILATIDALPAPMRTDRNKELVKKAVHPEVEFNHFEERYLGEHDVGFARERSRLLIANLEEVVARVTRDWAKLQHAFGLAGDLRFIHLTGSDFHNMAQQVAIVESTRGQKAVYKPRTTLPDQALTGRQGSAFAALNELGEGALRLPTMRFEQARDSSGEYSYVEFQTATPRRSQAETREYYRRYAQVLVATKLLGVNDLHGENVMSTAQGPAVIDAETAFLPYVMTARSFTTTGITDALRQFKALESEDLTNNYFVTPEEEQGWQRMSQREKDRLRLASYSQYVDNRRRNDLHGEANYRPAFREGLVQMLDVLQRKQQQIAEGLVEHTASLRMVRVVPLATTVFVRAMQGYHEFKRTGQPRRASESLANLVKDVEAALKEKGFVLSTYARATLIEVMEADFDRRDTPIIHFHPANNNLVYHGHLIGSHKAWRSPKKVVEENLAWIVSLTPDDILRDLAPT